MENMHLKTAVYVLCVTCLVVITTQVSGLTFLPKEQWNDSLQVSTRYGTIQGRESKTYKGKQYFSYEGIPFAKPPVGNLRFRAPQPISKWKRVLNATEEGSGCVELSLRLSTGIMMPGSEDCLYLNIHSPANPSNITKTYPVIFFIYGGAFLDGRGTKNLYGPDYLLERDLVVVLSNYRMNIFGFLSTQDEASPGNYGLKDQNAALKWVKNNIKNFGGDSNRITIVGQSAGGCSVMHHVVSPKSRGLFSRALAVSGDALSMWSVQKYPRQIANDMGIYFGMETDNTTELIEKLRQLDVEILKKALPSVFIANSLAAIDNGLPFTPTVEKQSDDAFITESTYDRLQYGRFNRVPIMTGFTNKEGNFFIEGLKLIQPLLLLLDLSPSSIVNSLEIPSKQHRRLVGEKIRRKYFGSTPISSGTPEQMVEYFDDTFFIRPISKTVKLASKYTSVYFYIFKRDFPVAKLFFRSLGYPVSVDMKGAAHTEDLTCMWRLGNNNLTSDDSFFCDKMTKLWKNFAYYGKPTPEPDPQLQNIMWPKVESSKNLTILSLDDNMYLDQNHRKDYLDFWDDIFTTYKKKPYYTY